MFLDYKTMMPFLCQREMSARQRGDIRYGPPKVYGIALCEIDTVMFGTFTEILREYAALIVVALDCVVMLVFAVAIIRLRWYERVSVSDMKKGKLKLEDFSVYLPNIPISVEDYGNSPELLEAMIAVHFEEIIGHEL